MAKIYVSEYKGMAKLNSGLPQVADESSLVTEYAIDFTGGVTPGAAFNAATAYVRVAADAVCSIDIGLAAVATTSMKRLAANSVEYFALGAGVGQGWRISAISNS